MRILHVVHQYLPEHVAGTELYTQTVARLQVSADHRVAVFTPVNRAGDSTVELSEENGVRVYRAPAGRRTPVAVFRSTYRHPALSAAFSEVVERERPDIVHLQHLMGLPAAVGDHLRDMSIPYVISLHDYWYGCANGQLLTNDTGQLCAGPDSRFHNCGRCAVARAGLAPISGLLGPAVAPLMRRRDALLRPIFAGAAVVLAPNEFVRHVHGAMGFPTGRVVLNPLGLDSPTDLSSRFRPVRADQSLRLGYVGSIARQKGIHTAVAAVNGLPERGVSLDIYGDSTVFPEYAAELRALARHPGIRFNGPVARDLIWDVLLDLDMLVLPTLWYEASPAIIREAFANGLPVIASDLGAPGSMIRDGVDGLLFPPGDEEALSEILLDLMARPGRVQELRAGIVPPRAMVEHVEEIDRHYRAVLSGRVPSA